jgi:hypothetical protein
LRWGRLLFTVDRFFSLKKWNFLKTQGFGLIPVTSVGGKRSGFGIESLDQKCCVTDACLAMMSWDK